LAPNNAQVFRHVPIERQLAGHNSVADIAGRAAQVSVIVGIAG